jgi:hypothetical protein
MKAMKRFHIGGFFLLVALMLAWTGPPSQAKDDYLPFPKPLGGAVKFQVNKSNVEQYKDKLPEGLYKVIKEWGHSINVYETVNDYSPPKGYQEATEKFAGTARVNKRGGLENYTAGLPFPEPKTGAEVMYNYDYKYIADDFYYIGDVSIMSSTGRERKLGLNYTRLSYQGRLFLEPKPVIPNTGKLVMKEISGFTYPEDVAGMALLTARYQDPAKGDDGWMYIPTIRRVRRISVAQRGDSSGGMDWTWDDYRGFSGKVSDYTWKLIGKKEMIIPFHAPTRSPKNKGILYSPDDVRHELRTVWVVEGVNVDKNYVYSRRRNYLEASSFDIPAVDLWDRRGALWKYIEISYAVDTVNHLTHTAYGGAFDLIGRRSTLVRNIKERVNSGLKESYFSTTNLQTTER